MYFLLKLQQRLKTMQCTNVVIKLCWSSNRMSGSAMVRALWLPLWCLLFESSWNYFKRLPLCESNSSYRAGETVSRRCHSLRATVTVECLNVYMYMAFNPLTIITGCLLHSKTSNYDVLVTLLNRILKKA